MKSFRLLTLKPWNCTFYITYKHENPLVCSLYHQIQRSHLSCVTVVTSPSQADPIITEVHKRALKARIKISDVNSFAEDSFANVSIHPLLLLSCVKILLAFQMHTTQLPTALFTTVALYGSYPMSRNMILIQT